MARGIERILDNVQWTWDYKGLYRHPRIPYGKLAGAIAAYAPGVAPDDVLVLVDDTVFGSAKDGLLLTRDALYSKKTFQSPRMVRLADIRTIEPGTNARMMVNGDEFFKADIVEHFAIGALAGRIASVMRSAGDGPSGDASRGGQGGAGAGRLAALHARMSDRAMAHVHETMGEGLLCLDELLRRQSRRMGGHLAAFESAARALAAGRSRPDLGPDVLEMALLVLLILHYYSLSQLPEEVKAEFGDGLYALYEVSESYKEGYRAEFIETFSRDFEMDEEDMRMIPAMFFNRDGTGDFDLKIPRSEVVVAFLQKLGVRRDVALSLRTEVEQDAGWWLAALAASNDGGDGAQDHDRAWHGSGYGDDADEDGDEDHDHDHHQDDGDGHGGPDGHDAGRDHYQVLGIRRQASQVEIDLAFKGRRSQYHPDRYANEGEDTVRWATREMQCVNDAYAVLSDAAQRERYDAQLAGAARSRPSSDRPRGRPADRPAPRPARPEPAPSASPGAARAAAAADPPDIREYFARLQLAGDDQARIHLAPRIPHAKLRNAIDARGWAGRTHVGTPLVLVDDTLGGGAREGLLVSEHAISFKSLFLDSEDHLIRFGVQGGFDVRGTTISRRGEACKEFVHVSRHGTAAICEALNAYLDDLRAWHRRRAEDGDAGSAHFMSGSSADPEQAAYWLEQAAERGLRVAQHNLARQLQYKDPAAAYRWFSLAAAQGCSSSQRCLQEDVFERFRTQA